MTQITEAATFGWAIKQLDGGSRVQRMGWNGKGMYLFYVGEWECARIEDNLYEHAPFIAMKTAQNTIIPWLASQADMLAIDWQFAPVAA